MTKKTILSLIVFLMVFTTIGLILWLVNMGLKYRYDQRFLNAMLDKRLIYLRNLPPNAQLTYNSKDMQAPDSFAVEAKDYPCTTDSFGFIVSGTMHQQPDLKFVFSGGSIPQSLYTDEEKRMPAAVAAGVEKLSGLKINVWNCAAGGTNSQHTLNVLSNAVLQLKPDYAFFYGNINDVATLAHYGTFYNTNLRWGTFFNIREFDRINRPSSSKILPYIQQAVQSGLKLNPIQDDFAEVRDSILVIDTLLLRAEVVRVYKTMMAVCKANDIQPVLITQVNLYHRLDYDWVKKNMPQAMMTEAGYENLVKAFDYYNDILRQLAMEEKVMLIDLSATDFDFSDFNDPSHFNANGYLKASRIVAKQFSEKAHIALKP